MEKPKLTKSAWRISHVKRTGTVIENWYGVKWWRKWERTTCLTWRAHIFIKSSSLPHLTRFEDVWGVQARSISGANPQGAQAMTQPRGDFLREMWMWCAAWLCWCVCVICVCICSRYTNTNFNWTGCLPLWQNFARFPFISFFFDRTSDCWTVYAWSVIWFVEWCVKMSCDAPSWRTSLVINRFLLQTYLMSCGIERGKRFFKA